MDGLEDNLEDGDGSSIASNVREILRNMPSNVIKPTIDSLETAANFVLRPWYGSALYGTYEFLVRVSDDLAKAVKRLNQFYRRNGARSSNSDGDRLADEIRNQNTGTLIRNRTRFEMDEDRGYFCRVFAEKYNGMFPLLGNAIIFETTIVGVIDFNGKTTKILHGYSGMESIFTDRGYKVEYVSSIPKP